ncbi:MAG: creatininase family protein [Acidobacteriota bacterium]
MTSTLEQYDFHNKNWCEIADYLARGVVLLLPIGSTEAHGPHLPLATDFIISLEMARRAAHKLTELGRPALVLPTLAYSITDFSVDFPGSISIRRETATAVISDILSSLIRQGFHYLCIANSHLEPAHIESIEAARVAAESETGVKICFPDKRRRRWAERLTAEFRSGACHAGAYESSLVMAARPELVNESLREQLPAVNISLSQAIKAGIESFKAAGGEQAYFGAPAEASCEEGEASYQALAQMLIDAIFETYPELQ